jgi:DNA-binding NtrC family response regulator
MLMARKIAILEDNADRQAVMRRCLADRFYTFDAHFFDESAEMIRFLDEHLDETLVISLDNDLELKPGPNGRLLDPGSGLEVAEYLAGRGMVCPVIIHTTNGRAAEAMTDMLHAAHWRTQRVIPFDDMRWVESDWFFAMRRAIVGPVKSQRRGSRS